MLELLYLHSKPSFATFTFGPFWPCPVVQACHLSLWSLEMNLFFSLSSRQNGPISFFWWFLWDVHLWPACSLSQYTFRLSMPLPKACCLLSRQMNKTDVQVFLLKVGVINTPHEGMSVSEQRDPGYKWVQNNSRVLGWESKFPGVSARNALGGRSHHSGLTALLNLQSSRTKHAREGRMGQCENLGVAWREESGESGVLATDEQGCFKGNDHWHMP